ncbi:MAG TPA: BON domain-containing protein [Usitatibacteraceae bacterium]
MRAFFAAVLLAVSAPLLQGCFPLAAVGVGATALALDDRRSTGMYIEDENVEWKARARLIDKDKYKDAHVNVTSYNLTVLLTGEVPTEDMKKDIGEAIRAIPNVRGIHNEVVIGGNSSLTSRSSDTIITTNVKARLINNGKVSPNHVKVVTESSVVYLMGIVTREESEAASDIARTTSGVSRVVKVFEIIDKAPEK